MSTTARLLSYDISAGSNASSGCGPATEVTGTSAAYSGDGAGGGDDKVITFTNSPDLSNVIAGHVLYLDVGATDWYLIEIASVDNTAKTVTLTFAVSTAIASGSAVNYSIGGTRQTPKRSATEKDWELAEKNWILELDDGTYDVTDTGSGAFIDAAKYSGTNPLGLVTVRALNMPATADDATVTLEWDETTHTAQWWFQRLNVSVEGIEMGPDATGNSATLGYWGATGMHYYRVRFKNDMSTAVFYIRYANHGTHDVFYECTFNDRVRMDRGFSTGTQLYFNCVIRVSQKFYDNPATNGALIFLFTTFYGAAGEFIGTSSASKNNAIIMVHCTFYANTSGSFVSTTASTFPWGAMFINMCSFSDAAAYALDLNNLWRHFPTWTHDYNHFNSNTSGNRDSSEPATTNEVSGSPLFANTGAGTVDLSTQSGSPLRDAGDEADKYGD